jgi:hypothetical protein
MQTNYLSKGIREVVDAREHLIEAAKAFDALEPNGYLVHTVRMALVEVDDVIQRAAFPDEPRTPLELVS